MPLDQYRSINVFIERLWRSLKYECVYLHAFETGSELRAGLSNWIGYYVLARTSSDRRRWLCEPMSVSAVVSGA
jgi:Integrase core domain